jgi:hypothetical protein
MVQRESEGLMKIALLVAFTFATSQVVAQTPPQAHPWSAEPTSFFGVQFGSPISQSLPECPKEVVYGVVRYNSYGITASCYEDNGGGWEIEHVEPMRPALVEAIDGRVSFISATFSTADSETVMNALLAKFGKPTESAVTTLQNASGAKFDRTTLRWEGKDVWIIYRSIGSRSDEGLLTVSTAASRAKMDAERQKAATNLKGVF